MSSIYVVGAFAVVAILTYIAIYEFLMIDDLLSKYVDDWYLRLYIILSIYLFIGVILKSLYELYVR